MLKNSSAKGFTLIELITVIVVMSILAVIGSGFMLESANAYHQSVNRSKLVQQSRQALERITRELRIAVPNSIKTSANNLCIEWLPIVGGGNYLGILPDQNNSSPATSSINTAPISIDFGTPRYVAVSPFSDNEIYGAAPGSMERFASVNTSAIPNVVNLAAAKQFLRNSINRRLFLADYPKQFCVTGGELRFHDNYTAAGAFPASGALTGAPPNGGSLIAQGVNISGEVAFSVRNSVEDRNTIVDIELPFTQGGERIVMRHQVMVRNVP